MDLWATEEAVHEEVQSSGSEPHEEEEEYSVEIDWEKVETETWSGREPGRLSLSSKSLSELPADVYNFHLVIELNLDFNDLHEVPNELCHKFTSLKKLSIVGNRLVSLPQDMDLMTQLEKINLKENRLVSLPEGFCRFFNLKSLLLQGNRLKELPANFCQLRALRELTLDDNTLETLPESFGELCSLITLDLSYNGLKVLPNCFGSLVSLEVLDLSQNKLTNFPLSFGQLPSLVNLELSDNRITELPIEFKSSDKLQKFSAENNDITLLPDWFGNLPNLTDLCLKSNFLRGDQFPEAFGSISRKLTNFDVSGNLLDSLPESFALITSIRYMDTGSPLYEPERKKNLRNGNNITHLPSQFGLCFHDLIELRLDECGLDDLPPCFGEGMESLEVLDLHCNCISSLPESFCNLLKLKSFTLSMNCLKKLPTNFGQLISLEELRLENNTLHSLPSTFDHLVNLRILDLFGNNFDSFPGILRNLPQIDCLDVGIQISEMVVQMNEREKTLHLGRLENALATGAYTWKRTNGSSIELNNELGHLSSRASSSEYLKRTFPSSLESLTSSDLTDESWDEEIEVDLEKPYANEPIEYFLYWPRYYEVQKSGVSFIPSKYHARRVQKIKVKFPLEEGQFDDFDC